MIENSDDWKGEHFLRNIKPEQKRTTSMAYASGGRKAVKAAKHCATQGCSCRMSINNPNRFCTYCRRKMGLGIRP